MATRYQKVVDLNWTDSGDFSLESAHRSDAVGTLTGGDFKDTSREFLKGWLQRVRARLGSSSKDWQYLGIGADLQSFRAAKNSEATGEALKTRIINELSTDDLVRPEEIRVEVIPLSPNHLGVIIAIRPPGLSDIITLTYSIGLRDTNTIQREV